MRTSNIEISFKMKYPCDKPDLNGCIYTKEAIRDALKNKNMRGEPILIEDNKGEFIQVGFVQEAEYLEDEKGIYIIGNGLIYYGGTNEIVDIKDNRVASMEIKGIGFTRE